MQPSIHVLGFDAVPSDAIYLILAASTGLAITTGQLRPRWHRFFGALAIYFGALVLSAFFSRDPGQSAVKILTQCYLLSLPIITFWLVSNEGDLRRVVTSWLLATAAVGMICIVALVLFYLEPESAVLKTLEADFGTLPPGNYPRLSLTFMNPNMLCNYLTASLGLLFVAWRKNWIEQRTAIALCMLAFLAAVCTISPGLGGIALLGGWLTALVLGERHGRAASLSRAAGISAGFLAVVAMTVTPILHPTAPFQIQVPATDLVLAPAGRLLTWLDACRNFVSDPLIGRGIGMNAVSVRYQNPSGFVEHLTDAHNTFLNIAVQAGVLGLGALCALVWLVLVIYRRERGTNSTVTTVLAFVFLDAFAYQGLGGSFEDARHLWVLLGLLLAGTAIFTSNGTENNRRAKA